MVHAYGRLRIIDDAVWIRAQIEALTAQNEVNFAHPWLLSDAPQDFTDKLIDMVVGIEMVIIRLSGKWKISQNQPLENKLSVIEGLMDNGQTAMAELVKTEIK